MRFIVLQPILATCVFVALVLIAPSTDGLLPVLSAFPTSEQEVRAFLEDRTAVKVVPVDPAALASRPRTPPGVAAQGRLVGLPHARERTVMPPARVRGRQRRGRRRGTPPRRAAATSGGPDRGSAVRTPGPDVHGAGPAHLRRLGADRNGGTLPRSVQHRSRWDRQRAGAGREDIRGVSNPGDRRTPRGVLDRPPGGGPPRGSDRLRGAGASLRHFPGPSSWSLPGSSCGLCVSARWDSPYGSPSGFRCFGA